MSHLQLVLWALPRQGYPAVLGGPGKCARICDENVLMCLKNEHSIILKKQQRKVFQVHFRALWAASDHTNTNYE